MDSNGLLLCELQAETFERSIDLMSASSAVFVRRFTKSKIVKIFDNGSLLFLNLQAPDLIERIEEEYSKSDYGSVKYSKEEMYWIGYLYRYFAYVYELSSSQVYKLLKPKELRDLYLPYHTLSPQQTIERILEAKGIDLDPEAELQRQFAIYKRIRAEKME